MSSTFAYPPKPKRGDRVAVLSPSGRSAARFPAPFDLGLKRLRDELDLEPVEYPTTRAVEASPVERARDIHAAWADPEIKAVIATIGGDDELKVLAHLDPVAFVASPKPFFGYSDNTNLHLFLWNAGLVTYHGGAVMVQLGRPGSMNQTTRESLERALFTDGLYIVKPPVEYSDEEVDWREPGALAAEPRMRHAEDWSWHGPAARVTGSGWGGNLEVVDFHLRTSRYLLSNERYRGSVLFLETSEEMPSATYVYRVLTGMGERGLLQQFAAVLWARPKAWSHEQPLAVAERASYVEAQRHAVLTAFAEYNPDVPIVFGVDFGHTDPQSIIPSGGEITVDAERQSIAVRY
jgi:muramoyltetrapeptide carboxypeptidase LdcA involved in peptidoglycan recycling